MAPPSRQSSVTRDANDSPAAESPANNRIASRTRQGLRQRSTSSVTSPESRDSQISNSLSSRVRRRQAAATGPVRRRRRNQVRPQARSRRPARQPARSRGHTQPRSIRTARPRNQAAAPAQARPRGRPRGRRNQGTQTIQSYVPMVSPVNSRRRRAVERPRNSNPSFRRSRLNNVRAPRFPAFSRRRAIRQPASRIQHRGVRRPRLPRISDVPRQRQARTAIVPRQRQARSFNVPRQRQARRSNVPRPHFSGALVNNQQSFSRIPPAASRTPAFANRVPNRSAAPGMDMSWMRDLMAGLGPQRGAAPAPTSMPDPMMSPMEDQAQY